MEGVSQLQPEIDAEVLYFSCLLLLLRALCLSVNR